MESTASVGMGERKAPVRAAGFTAQLAEPVFDSIRSWIYEMAGISLSKQKKALVMGRLAPRLRHYGLSDYGDYLQLLRSGREPGETQIAVDLLTTNETHFFREPKHFDFLRERILPQRPAGRPFRVWSAASSSGEEPYSIAMTLAAALGEAPWEIVASDLSSRVLARARTGHYAMTRAKSIPGGYLRDYCLKGVGAQAGTFLVDPKLRSRVQFMQVNLIAPLSGLGQFDLIFLRNVMIYFDMSTKRQVVARIAAHLNPGAHLFVGHSESLNGITEALKPVQPSIYRKP